jgi:predicted DNA-binding transcriptional regulator YafY
MKLYNLFESLILEEVEKTRSLITEGVSTDDVRAAIDGKYNVNILYRDYEDQPPSKRYIQVYNLGRTKGGNEAIRAYQIFGGSKRGNKNGFWKIFRLDRIDGWFPTKVKWVKPVSDFDSNIPKYNATGDRSMSQVMHKVNVNQQQTQRK